ncbi:sec-independent protein translocase protein TatB [Sphaerotilus hippei]|uniref:Sec-independent protein translocase protein TatB n=1 Tax=Sphaerotilus hippei TaxID=744406 RepID=A0A318H0B3_9BURK|nr:Sec-independent protein translocase protein TatB [Sphaerotilus hippei]PXW96174.1 sec-independent protein translocase protein TatB [Sphaerotilus hippei]
MLDIGITKIMLIGGIALVVIGPERLPRVARTIGTLLGRAQRYVTDVKAEVSRSIEIEELNKVRQEVESAARDVHQSVQSGIESASEALDPNRDEDHPGPSSGESEWWNTPTPAYKPPRKNWRVKRGAMPQWYKQQQGVRRHVQSAAARVARHRPRPARPF